MKRFKLSILGLTSILCLGFASTAFAYPHGGGYSGSNTQLSEEQIAKYNQVSEQYRITVEPIMQQLLVKEAELDALMLGDNPSAAKIESLSKDIGGLRGKLLAERTKFGSQLEGQGISTWNHSGNGYNGYGHRGYGNKGYGHNGYGNKGGRRGHGNNCMW